MHVNGSFIQNAFWVLRLPHTGRILRVGFLGYNPHHATVQSEETEPYQVSENGAAAEEEGITLSFSGRKRFQVETSQWRMTAESTIAHPHANIMRMNIRVTSLYRVCSGRVAPHGILGQTFDCDGMAVHGEQDSYNTLDSGKATRHRRGVGGVVTTKAQGEGALEGKESDYLLNERFGISFAFSVFNVSAATKIAHRDARMLTGAKAKHRRKLEGCSCIDAPAYPPSPPLPLVPPTPPMTITTGVASWMYNGASATTRPPLATVWYQPTVGHWLDVSGSGTDRVFSLSFELNAEEALCAALSAQIGVDDRVESASLNQNPLGWTGLTTFNPLQAVSIEQGSILWQTGTNVLNIRAVNSGGAEWGNPGGLYVLGSVQLACD